MGYAVGLEGTTRNETVAIGTTSTNVAFARKLGTERIGIVLRNTSDNDADIITVNLGFQPAVAEEGIVLRKNDVFSDSNSEGYRSWQGTITAICATANGQLSVLER